VYNKAKTQITLVPSGITNVNIPDSVTSIMSSAFSGCTSLTAINVDSGNTAYSSQDGVLYNKDKTQIVKVPRGITGNVTIPNSVTSIGTEVFSYCTSLTGITIGSGVTSIGYRAFKVCTSLTSITIGSGVKSIGSEAFMDCRSLTSVKFEGTIASSNFSSNNTFEGSLRTKFYETNPTNGTPGTYTRSGSGTSSSPYTWTKTSS